MILKPIELPLQSGITIRGLHTERRTLPLLAFLHGNGLAAGVYRPMFELLADRFDILALDVPGHGNSDNLLPFAGWNETAQIMHSAFIQSGLLQGRPVYGCGHSLGGVLTLLSAQRHPGVYRSLMLLDPIIFPPSLLLIMQLFARLNLTDAVHPHVGPTKRRKNHWADRHAAGRYFEGRGIFKTWTDDALQSYLDFALQKDPAGGVRLACDPETEATFFATLPRGLWRALDGVQCPVNILMGHSSYPFAHRAAKKAQRRNRFIQVSEIAGSHCYMQEDPDSAAAEVELAWDKQTVSKYLI